MHYWRNTLAGAPMHVNLRLLAVYCCFNRKVEWELMSRSQVFLSSND